MESRTGAERYLAKRLEDPGYAAEFERVRARIAAIDAVLRTLDEERRAQELSKAELARRAGLRPEAVRRIFSQSSANPTMATLLAIAEALDLELRPMRPGGVSPRPVTAARAGDA